MTALSTHCYEFVTNTPDVGCANLERTIAKKE
jgi:hypothetical protein